MDAEIFIILPMCVALSKGKNPQGLSSTNSLQARKILKIGELIEPQDSVAGRLIDKLKKIFLLVTWQQDRLYKSTPSPTFEKSIFRGSGVDLRQHRFSH